MNEIGTGLLLWGGIFVIQAFANPHDEKQTFLLISGIALMVAGGALLYT